MSIYVQRDGETYGPFSREEVLEHLQEGVFLEDDLACTEGNLEGRPILALLNEEEANVGLEIPAQEDDEQVVAEEQYEEPVPTGAIPSLLDLQIHRESRLLQQSPGEEPVKSRKVLILAMAAGVFLVSGAAAFFLGKPASPNSQIAASSSSTPLTSSTTSKTATAGIANQQVSKPAVVQESPVPSSTPVNAVPPPVIASADELSSQASTPKSNEDLKGQESNPEGSPIAESSATPMKTATPAKTPKPVLAQAQRINFPTGKDVPRGDLWYAQTTTGNPKAVLLFCLPPNGGTQDAVKSEDWQNFAGENGFVLAAISFGSDRDLLKVAAGDTRPGTAAEVLLINGLQSAFGNTPLILYGRNAGGTFAATFAIWHPEMVKVWAAYTSDWPSVSRPDKTSPPGILACDNEVIKRGKSTVHDFFLAGRAQDKPWIFVPIGIGQEAKQQKSFDAFFSDYVKALMSDSNPKGVWVGMESKKLYSSLDRMRDPKGAEWLPDASLIDSWTSLMSDEIAQGKASILQKNIATSDAKQPNLKLYLRLPSAAKSGKDVSGVIAYCTSESKESNILAALGDQEMEKHSGYPADLIKFAELNNMAVLEWGSVEIPLDHANKEEVVAAQQSQFDPDFDALAAAWEKGVNQFASETGIPRNDYLLYGISSGAQFAHKLALRNPDYFLAVHIHTANSYDTPTPNASGVMWLVTTGEMDDNYKGSVQFYKESRRLGYPIIFKAIMGLGHNDSRIADDLGIRFFQYALSLRDLHDQYEAQRRMHVAASGAPSAATWLQSFRAPEYVGDFLNQDCYPSTQLDMVPDTLQVPLPNKTLADAWNK